jgi:hypothetical protein
MPKTKIDELDKKKVIFENNKQTPQDKKEEALEIPKYMSELELPDDRQKVIVEEIMEEFKAIKKEREDAHLEEEWNGLDDQDEGNIEESEDRQFNLHKHSTKVKVDAVAGALTEAFLDTDPIYSVTPRPEYQKEGGLEVCEKQQDFLDYKMDNTIPLKREMPKGGRSAGLKGVGIIKLSHKIKRTPRKREEVYEGKEGLKEFKRTWPEEVQKYPGYIKRLEEGKKVNLVVKYKETTYNDPYPEYINLKNFYVRLNTKGYEGLKTTKLIVEMQEYTWWELKQMENEPNGFFNVDKLMYGWDKNAKPADRKETDLKKFSDYKTRKYQIMECTYYFKETGTEEDGKEIKGVFWVGMEREVMIGSVYYQYWGVDCNYFPIYIKQEKEGFYQPGIGKDLTSSNLAEDALLNFILEAAWSANIDTPITDSDDIERQFLNKEWTHGVPLKKKKNETIDFLSKYRQMPDIGSLVQLLQYLVKGDDDVSGVSSLMSGRESEFDPSAPARKTLALLQQSGKNIKRYIYTALPTFNEIGQAILQMYYQISKEGREYKIRPERAAGGDPKKIFGKITRAEMIARTNIESRAMSFDFDKLALKKELYALYQIIRPELLIAKNPRAVHKLLRLIIKSWGPLFKNSVDEILPSLEQLKQEELQVVNQALVAYIDAQVKKAQATKQPLELPLEPLMQLVGQVRKEMVTAPTKEEIQARKKGAK